MHFHRSHVFRISRDRGISLVHPAAGSRQEASFPPRPFSICCARTPAGVLRTFRMTASGEHVARPSRSPFSAVLHRPQYSSHRLVRDRHTRAAPRHRSGSLLSIISESRRRAASPRDYRHRSLKTTRARQTLCHFRQQDPSTPEGCRATAAAADRARARARTSGRRRGKVTRGVQSGWVRRAPLCSAESLLRPRRTVVHCSNRFAPRQPRVRVTQDVHHVGERSPAHARAPPP